MEIIVSIKKNPPTSKFNLLFVCQSYAHCGFYSCAGYLAHQLDFLEFLARISSGNSTFPFKWARFILQIRTDHIAHYQGDHILIGRGENFEEIIFSQGGLELLGMNFTFGGFLLFEQIESDIAQHSKVLGCLVFAYSTTIFIQSNIQNPMQFIFNGPMFAYSL